MRTLLRMGQRRPIQLFLEEKHSPYLLMPGLVEWGAVHNQGCPRSEAVRKTYGLPVPGPSAAI